MMKLEKKSNDQLSQEWIEGYGDWSNLSKETMETMERICWSIHQELVRLGIECGVGIGRRGLVFNAAPYRNICEFSSSSTGDRIRLPLLSALDFLLSEKPNTESQLFDGLCSFIRKLT